jgi:heme exporter protein A
VGKTTLLKILANILEPNEGEIFWNGKNIKKNPFDFYKDLTFIMDKQTSKDNLTVNENILFWRKLFSSKISIKELDSILNLLLLEKYKNTEIRNLSYGEIKKLELSRLIIEQKKLWLLDEPYIGLDNATADLVNQTILNHTDMGGMVVFSSHIVPSIRKMNTINMN